MTLGPVQLKIGRHLLDVMDPRPELIDIAAIEDALWSIRRFSNNPRALLVRQHTKLVSTLAQIFGEPPEVVQWCEHHDDHEGIIGDIPGPLKTRINLAMAMSLTTTLDEIEQWLDGAICTARGIDYPTVETRRRVHFYDKLAETLEWRFVLNEPFAVWNKPVDDWFSEAECRALVVEAMDHGRSA